MADIKQGDLVRRGKGRVTYWVSEFWTAGDGTPMASLIPTRGYTTASAPLSALTVVAGPAS